MSPMQQRIGRSLHPHQFCFPAVIAARTASTSDTAAGVCSIPHWVNTLSISRKVPP